MPVRSSSFAPCWATLPTPPRLQFLSRDGSDPMKPGWYQLAMSLVDDAGRPGPMSEPVLFHAIGPNWNLRIRWHGLPKHTPAVAVMLWFRKVDWQPADDPAWLEWSAYNGNVDEVVQPFLPLTGWDSHSKRCLHVKRADRGYPQMRWPAYHQWPQSTTITSPPIQPTIELLHVPNKRTGVRFAWVENEGESLPSDPLWVDQLAGFAAGNNSPIHVCRVPELPPNGALGMHVYVCDDEQTGQWHRQTAPHTGVAIGPDCWLWPLAMQSFDVERIQHTCIEPAVMAGRSWLSSRNRAVYESQESVIIDSYDLICCPIISPHRDNEAKFYDHRTIAGELGQRVDYVKSHSTPDGVTGYPMGWPMWIETAQRTRLVGAYFRQPWTGTPQDGVGIDLLSYIGSSCFHFRPERTFIQLEGGGHSVGIRSLAEANSYGYDAGGSLQTLHHPSEPLWSDTEIGAKFPIVIEGNQAANWGFHNTTAVSVGDQAEHCVITQNNFGNLKFTGRTTTDGGRALASVVTGKQLKIDEWFSDQGHWVWIVFGVRIAATVRLECAATNHQGHWKSFLHVAEAPAVGQLQNTLIVTGNSGNVGWSVPPPGPYWITHTDVKSTIFCPAYCRVRYSLDPMFLLDLFTPPKPDYQQWQSMEYTNAYGPQRYFVNWDNNKDQAEKVGGKLWLG